MILESNLYRIFELGKDVCLDEAWYMYLNTILLLIIIMSSCSSLEGKYQWKCNGNTPDNIELILMSNNEYQWRSWSDV